MLCIYSILVLTRQADFLPEDLSINEIESVTEFFAEIVFGIDNAFEEHDEPDNDGGGSFDFSKIFYIKQHSSFASISFDTLSAVEYHIFNAHKIKVLALEINSPPPRV